ncbi:MAG: ParB/RepB/Spo0J family partition protein [Candidatus Eiseniibacteriota bacterium]
MTRKALGRGLGALIPGAPAPYAEHDDTEPAPAPAPGSVAVAAPPTAAGGGSALPAGQLAPGQVESTPGRPLEIPIEAISPNPRQPRLDFQAEALDELAESIRSQGILQPVLVRPHQGGYQLVAGERRLRAARQVGLKTIPAFVRELADDELLEVALIENLQREDLNPIEEALGYQRLINELQFTHDRLSQRLGRNRTSITNALRLLVLPQGVREMVSRGTLSAGHARALLGLASGAEIEASARYVVDMGLSVRKTEALVARKLRRKTASRRPRGSGAASQHAVDAVSSTYSDWTDRLRRHLATQVRIVRQQGERGQIEIEYYGETDLERLLELLGVAQ